MNVITEAIIQMVKIGNMLNWNAPIDQDFVNAINGLRRLRQATEQGVAAELLLTGPEDAYCHRCDDWLDDCQCQPAIG